MECPDCKSESVQSKGYRTKGVHRYLCNSCGRNFTIDHREKVILPSKIQEEVTATEGESKETTIRVSREIHIWLTELKLIQQEPINSVLMRIKNSEHWEKGI